VTGTGLSEFHGLGSLREILLEDCPVTDLGMTEIGTLKGLETLCLNNCKTITNVDLKQLTGLKKLSRLSLFGTKITAADAKELNESLPDVEILR
jgi:hypothetical protein